MGTAEWVAVGLGIMTLASTVIGFFLAASINDGRKLKDQVADLRTGVALIQEKIIDHGAQLRVVAELAGDMREIKPAIERLLRFLDRQEDPDRHRRSTDPKET